MDQPDQESKQCSVCEQIKPVSNFYSNKRMRCGYTSACRECTKQQTAKTKTRQAESAKGITEKECRDCCITKPIEEFDRHKTSKFGRNPICKICRKTSAAQRRNKQRDCPQYRKKRQHKDRAQGLREYGLTIQDYEAMHEAQKGLCAICGQPETTKHRNGESIRFLGVDHDHTTGQIRALLCSRCNFGIGSFLENPDTLIAAAEYLRQHKIETNQ